MKDIVWPKAVLFDLDGTLIETLPDIQASVNKMLSHRNLSPLDMDTVRGFIGKGSWNLMVRSLRAHGQEPSEQEIEAALHDFTMHYDADPIANSFAYDGVPALLDRLRDSGLALAVCTNKQKGTAVEVLRGLGLLDYFDVVIGGDEVEHRKPDPRHIDVVLSALNITRDDALFVGDSENDIEAAVAAELPCIAVSFGYCHVPMSSLSPTVVVDHYDEIWPLLEPLRP